MMVPLMPDASFESFAAEILERARGAALDVVPSLEIESHLGVGGRIQQLLAFAGQARLIVLGSPSPRSFDRIWTGGTVTAVASRSACPVVVVPADRESAEVRGRIVIGVKSPERVVELLDTAFPLAEQLDAELVVVHTWLVDGVYDAIIADRTTAARWQYEHELTEKGLAPHREAFPTVPVRVFVRHESPAHALVRASRGADRLLILRSGRGPVHLGRTARAVLRDARCPVEVVPARRGAGRTACRTPESSAQLVP